MLKRLKPRCGINETRYLQSIISATCRDGCPTPGATLLQKSQSWLQPEESFKQSPRLCD